MSTTFVDGGGSEGENTLAVDAYFTSAGECVCDEYGDESSEKWPVETDSHHAKSQCPPLFHLRRFSFVRHHAVPFRLFVFSPMPPRKSVAVLQGKDEKRDVHGDLSQKIQIYLEMNGYDNERRCVPEKTGTSDHEKACV
jgi:hypothetical protein